ncbi:MAG: protein kinase [Planctomycetes bacterium]|nr:protein kinase [Planctomycetota bacterium]
MYLATQIHLQRKVAVKVLRSPVAAGREEHARMRAEADALAKLQHPNIVGIHDFGEIEGQPYLVLEFVEGESLAAWWRQQKKSPRLAAIVIERLARAIHYAHAKGIVHRDLKPANVLMVSNSNEPKITDFGLAKYYQQMSGQTHTGAILGTVTYMAPEQASGRVREIGPCSDIYALGAMLYELTTGRPPIERDTIPEALAAIQDVEPRRPTQVAADVPGDLETICLKCLRKDPGKRYASSEALAGDLQCFLDGRPIQAKRVTNAERLRLLIRRNQTLSALVGVAILLFVTGFGMVTWKWLEANDHRATAEKHANNLSLVLNKEKLLKDEMAGVSYFDKIALADREFQANNADRAAELLKECPESLRGWEWHYLHRLCHSAPVVCNQNGLSANGLVFSTKGTHVAAWGDAWLAIIDAATGQPNWSLSDTARVFCVAWNPVEARLAIGDETGKICIRDANTGKPLSSFETNAGPVTALAYSPDGRLLAFGDRQSSIHVRNSDGKQVHHFSEHKKPIAGVVFHPRKPLLISASDDASVIIWNLETSAAVRTLTGHKLPIRGLAFHPDGVHIAAGSSMIDSRMPTKGSIIIWNIETGVAVRTLAPNGGSVNSMAISRDGRVLAAACSLGVVRRWDWQDFTEFSSVRLPGSVPAVSFGADERMAVTDDSGLVKIWNSRDAQEPRNLRHGGKTSVTALAVHPNKRELAFGDGAGQVEILNRDSGAQLYQWPAPTDEPVWSLAYSPNGDHLAAGRHDNTIQLGRPDSATPAVLKGHDHRVYGVAFSPDSQRLFSGSTDHTIKIWDVATGKNLHTRREHEHHVRGVAVNPQGSRLASVATDRTVRIWDLATFRQLKTWEPHKDLGASSVVFHPDGKIIATGGESRDANIRFWDSETGAQLAVGMGHQRKVASVAFSPDGRRLVSTSDDGTVRIWEPRTGRLIITLNGHVAGSTTATFTPDGQSVISASWDRTIRVWDATPWGSTATLDRPTRR